MASALKPVCLVVEDETIIMALAVELAAEAGYEVIEANNADDAIRILGERDDIRVVFTDIEMPGSMDGLRLARAVRERWPPVELIIVSGRTDITAENLPSRGIFFPKPYNVTQIVEALQRFRAGFQLDPN
jgi:DNA-binding NtrC family response regulator